MAQFLIVQGSDRDQTGRLFSHALDLFSIICAVPRAEILCEGATSVARFPMRHNDCGGIVSEAERWILGVGTWFQGRSSGRAALERSLRESQGSAGEFRISGVENLNGVFSLVAGAADGSECLIVTDPIGSMHVYARHIGRCLIVSTSSLVLAALEPCHWEIDSCREFLATGTIFEDRTLFREIRKLKPATIYRASGGTIEAIRKYWRLAEIISGARHPYKGTVEELAENLTESVRVITDQYPNPAVDITGGLDSRVVAAAMLSVERRFTAVVTGGENDIDVVLSRRIAQRFGLPHIHHPVLRDGRRLWEQARRALSFCDGEYNVLLYARILDVHEPLSETFDVSINGSNGEICKGYWWEVLHPRLGRPGNFDAQNVAAKRFVFEGDVNDLLAHPFEEDIATYFAGVIRRANVGLEQALNTAQMDHVYLTLRMQRWQGRIASSTSRLWPLASPFLWRRVMEIALSAPPAARIRQRMTRRLIERMLPSLAALPTAIGGPALPLRLSTAHRFFPFLLQATREAADRLRRSRLPAKKANPVSELWKQEELRETLMPETMRSAALYRPEALQAFLADSSSQNFSAFERFGRILTLEMVARVAQVEHP
jgi:asparagine synthetase B (glutamine-hydrolysing)